MQPVLERGSIDKPLTFDVGLIQLSFIPVCSPNTCNQIALRVCTLVLFIVFSIELSPSVENKREFSFPPSGGSLPEGLLPKGAKCGLHHVIQFP